MIRFGCFSTQEGAMELTAKLFQTYIKVLPQTSCWEYLGAKDSQGYGRMFLGGKECKAQRVAYQMEYGPLPPKARLLHLLPDGQCIGRACCNPDHLKVFEPLSHIAESQTRKTTLGVKICKNGHRITGDNIVTETRPDGRIQERCRICCQEKWRTRKAALKEMKMATA